MKIRYYAYAIAVLAFALDLKATGQEPAPPPSPVSAGVETIVFFRHGEKPPGGLGQLTCQGLNRALALPSVLLAKFGKPDYLFAPDPAARVFDGTIKGYDYVRPLATIEPTAIRLGMPVNCDYRFDRIKDLEDELLRPQHDGKLIFIAWEHKYLNQMVKDLLQVKGGNPNQVPDWPWYEYDRIYILRIPAGNGPITLSQDQENLNHVSDDCPEIE